jgi:hypothetical protein
MKNLQIYNKSPQTTQKHADLGKYAHHQPNKTQICSQPAEKHVDLGKYAHHQLKITQIYS